MDFNSAVVTGGTGHLGNVLIRELLLQHKKVRAIVLPDEDLTPLASLNVEIIKGDVTDKQSLISALRGEEVVFHLAGIINISHSKRKLLYEVNVEGTKNVIAACQETGVKRLLYTSSIHAFTEPKQSDVLNEEAGYNPKAARGDYGKTKATASLAVIGANGPRLETVLACPTGAIGPYDFKSSEMGQIIADHISGRLPIMVNGGFDFVDVRDIAKGLILVAQKGRPGESYILSGGRLDLKELIRLVDETIAPKKKIIILPNWIAWAISPFAVAYYFITRTKALLTPYALHTLNIKYPISDAKARQELGYTSRPFAETIKDTVAWLKSQNKF